MSPVLESGDDRAARGQVNIAPYAVLQRTRTPYAAILLCRANCAAAPAALPFPRGNPRQRPARAGWPVRRMKKPLTLIVRRAAGPGREARPAAGSGGGRE